MYRKTAVFFMALLAIFMFSNIEAAKRAQKNKQREEAPPIVEPEYPPVDQMLGSMLMLGFRGAVLGSDDEFLKLVAEGKIGNVILFDRDVTENTSRNIVSPEQTKALIASLREAAKRPIFIGVDQEGGQVRRLKPKYGFMDLPSAQSMGQGNPHDTLRTAEALGQEMHGLGINLDLAPVVDVDSNPLNPAIGRLGRSFNTNAALVAQHALAFGQGLAKNGVAPVLKHFPGQGCASADTHLGSADISKCWNPEVDLLPYAEIFQKGWPGMVMVGHLFLRGFDPDLPATLSRNIVTELLREGMGWQGVVISDDLQMKAVAQGRDLREIIRLAVEAGNDILLFGNNLEWDAELPGKVWSALRSLHDEGIISVERIRQSWRRISSLHAVYSESLQQ